MTPSSNMYGATGLIDMPSGEAQSDGQLWATTSHFGPISRNTLSFQITPRISASFRYLGIRDWNKHLPSWLDTNYDRSFDIRFKALDESRYLPAVTIGLQDFVGTGILAGEYVVATKTLTPNIKVTAGLGWGRLASRGNIGSPFGVRPNTNFGLGGKSDPKVWFRGPAAPFGGVEWKINDDWTFKGEYSSDNYQLEAGSRKTFDHKSPFNFGVEYQPNDYYRLGAYYMYGSKVGISGQFFLNPKKHVEAGITDRAPHPVKPRPNRNIDQDAYSSAWITQENVLPILRNNAGKWLKDDGIVVESIGFSSANTVRVEIENTRFSNGAQAVGRTARVLSNVMPASVEVFEIVPLSNGVPAAKIVVNRSDLEALEFSPDAIEQMAGRVNISGDTRPDPGMYRDKDLYPKFEWAFAPSLDLGLFDPNSPVRADVRARLSAVSGV